MNTNTATKWAVEAAHVSVSGVHTLAKCNTLSSVLRAISLETGEYVAPSMEQIARAANKARAAYGRQVIGTFGSFKYFVTSLEKSEEEWRAWPLA